MFVFPRIIHAALRMSIMQIPITIEIYILSSSSKCVTLTPISFIVPWAELQEAVKSVLHVLSGHNKVCKIKAPLFEFYCFVSKQKCAEQHLPPF